MRTMAIQVSDWLNRNPWLNLIFLFLAVTSITVTIIVYLRSKREKLPVFNLQSYNLIRCHLRKLGALQIMYKDEPLVDLTLSRIALWNRGRDTINRKDVAPKDQLRIKVPEGAHVLEATIDHITSPVNAFAISISQDLQTVNVDFDYFHTNEGVVLSVYHTGAGPGLQVLGTIKGTGSFKKGFVRENDLVFAFLDQTAGKILPLGWIRKTRQRKFLILTIVVPVFILLALPILIVAGIEIILRWKRRPPKEFSLQSED